MQSDYGTAVRRVVTACCVSLLAAVYMNTLERLQHAAAVILPYDERADEIQLNFVKVHWTDNEYCAKHGNDSCTMHFEFARCYRRSAEHAECDSVYSLVDLSPTNPDGCAKCDDSGVIPQCVVHMDEDACEDKLLAGHGMEINVTVLDVAGYEVAKGVSQVGRGHYIGSLPCTGGNTPDGRPYPCVSIDYMLYQTPGMSGASDTLVGHEDDD